MKLSKNVDILLIDGDPVKRNDLALRLRSLGHLIDMAKNGFHAIKEIEDNNYKLLVISDHMEDMSIEEIVTIVRSMGSKEKTPIALFDPPVDDSLNLDTLITELTINHVLLERDFNKLVGKIQRYVKK